LNASRLDKKSRIKYYEIPRALSEIPANVTGQARPIWPFWADLHWVAANLKKLAEFQNIIFSKMFILKSKNSKFKS